VLAGAVESKLMRSNFEPVVGEFCGLNLSWLFDENIIYAIAPLTDEVLMSFDERVEMLQTSE
jgi:hypothetical protein